jgi:hypothetical protein
MKFTIFIPLHIATIKDIYMANVQSLFLGELKRMCNILSIMTIDEDQTNKFDDFQKIKNVDCFLDLRELFISNGIVIPTLKAIQHTNRKCDVFIRMTQDTQIINIEKFVHLLNSLSSTSINGRSDFCNNIGAYLKEIGINYDGNVYKFVQGNLIIAHFYLWEKYYSQLPKSIFHYSEDSVFSYLCEHCERIKPNFIKMDFWKENRTVSACLENIHL